MYLCMCQPKAAPVSCLFVCLSVCVGVSACLRANQSEGVLLGRKGMKKHMQNDITPFHAPFLF